MTQGQPSIETVISKSFEKLFDPLAPLPRRTGRTSLTDDELLLFDFLFDRAAALVSLSREAYPIHMNVRYTHTLDSDALQKKVAGLLSAGWLKISYQPKQWPGHRRRTMAHYRLTSAGGRLWELERQPSWKQYCTEARLATKMVISAIRLRTARAYLDAWQKCGLLFESISRIKVVRRARRRLVPWKVFAASVELHAYFARSDLEHTAGEVTGIPGLRGWDCYERSRTWWRSIEELVTL
jgi:hypothetical protein